MEYFILKVQKYILKYLINLVPFKNGRKKIRQKFSVGPRFYSVDRDFANILLSKKNELLSTKNEIERLFIGNSHGECAIHPIVKGFNMSATSMDLHYKFGVYERFYKELPCLKSVILLLDLWDGGFELEKTIGKYLCAYYNKIWGVQNKFNLNLKLLEYEIEKYVEHSQLDIITVNGCTIQKEFAEDTKEFLVERTKKHLRENRRGAQQLEYIKKFANLTAQNNQELIIVFPPARNDYKNLLPSSDELFNEFYKIYPKEKVLNFYDQDFQDEDFGDGDHLNEQGATKFTKKLEAILK